MNLSNEKQRSNLIRLTAAAAATVLQDGHSAALEERKYCKPKYDKI